MTRFTDELHTAAAPIWQRQHSHPFVTGIGDGTLDVERFAYFIRQDYLFLIEYSRVLALGAARAPDLQTMRRFAELAQATLVEEMALHRSFAKGFGIDDLEREAPGPTTQAYTDHLVRCASHGDFSELVAALLPCMWGYAEVGQRLAERGKPDDERYATWIDMYASDDFAELAGWCREVVDGVGDRAPETTRDLMRRAFITCSRYELRFWQASWDREGWPI